MMTIRDIGLFVFWLKPTKWSILMKLNALLISV